MFSWLTGREPLEPERKYNIAEDFFNCCRRRDVRRLKKLLKDKQLTEEDMNANYRVTYYTSPALVECAEKGYVDIVEILLADKRINPNAQTEFQTTALFVATENGNIDIVKALLRHPNTDINIPRSDGRVPVYSATSLGHLEIARMLLDHPKLDLVNVRVAVSSISCFKKELEQKATCGIMFLACAEGKDFLVESLLKVPKEVQEVLWNEEVEVLRSEAPVVYTPLKIACERNFIRVVKMLINDKDFAKCLKKYQIEDCSQLLIRLGFWYSALEFHKCGFMNEPCEYFVRKYAREILSSGVDILQDAFSHIDGQLEENYLFEAVSMRGATLSKKLQLVEFLLAHPVVIVNPKTDKYRVLPLLLSKKPLYSYGDGNNGEREALVTLFAKEERVKFTEEDVEAVCSMGFRDAFVSLYKRGFQLPETASSEFCEQVWNLCPPRSKSARK